MTIAAMNQDLLPGLYIVATPIGNLGDITRRAVATLERADLIACEDSRVTAKLLHHLGLKRQMVRYNDHSDAQDRERLIDAMRDKVVVLVSDAGRPLISDTGYKLVREAQAAGVMITTLPGPNAAIAALTLSGLPSDRFLFVGFLPTKSQARRRELDAVAQIEASLVFYESGARLAACLAEMRDVLGNRSAAVVREITKKFEECRPATLADLAEQYAHTAARGEIVVVVGPPLADTSIPDDSTIDEALLAALADMPAAKAASTVAKRFGLDRKQLYDRATRLKDNG